MKGGSDNRCYLRPPKVHFNCETVASSRLIMFHFVMIHHRLSQLFSDQTTAPIPITERWNNCKGIVYKVHEIVKENTETRKRHRCSMCGMRTSYYCMGCHAWFCFSSTNKNTNSSPPNREDAGGFELISSTVKTPQGAQTYSFESSCFHIKHEHNWTIEEANKDANSLSTIVSNMFP